MQTNTPTYLQMLPYTYKHFHICENYFKVHASNTSKNTATYLQMNYVHILTQTSTPNTFTLQIHPHTYKHFHIREHFTNDFQVLAKTSKNTPILYTCKKRTNDFHVSADTCIYFDIVNFDILTNTST